MTTYMAKKQELQRNWYVLDAAGKPMGRTAAIAATLLRGKHKPEFTPNVDCGDFVIIINAKDALLTGHKLDQKYYRTHSRYIGSLRETSYRTLMKTKPELAVSLAVKGMVPKTSIGRDAMTRLKVFAGPEHTHSAQKPEPWAAE